MMEMETQSQRGAMMVFADDAQGEAALASYAAEIRTLHAQAWANLCRIGRLLTQAKERVAHGAWGQWLETQCQFNQETANRFMRVYRELGDDARFDGIGQSALYILAGAPAEDRDKLLDAAQNGASTRALTAEAARLREERQAARDQCAQLEKALADARAREEQARTQADAMRQQCADAKTLCDELRAQLDKSKREEAEPRIVETVTEVYPMDYDAAKERAQEFEKAAACLDRELSEARAALAQAERELEEARRAGSGGQAIAPAKKPKELKNMSADAFAREAGRMLAACAAIPYMVDAFDFMPDDMRGRYEDVLVQLEAFCDGARRALNGLQSEVG